jgi:hypothetical protein
MTSEKFVSDIRQQIIINGMEFYRRDFNTITESKDEAWQVALDIYHQLPNDKKDKFLGFIRLVISNSVSHFLGIIDGASFLNENRDEVILLDKETNQKLNDDLQDLFLEKEEDN